MGDTATTVINQDDGSQIKQINAVVVEEDLVDALTNMMHVEGDAMPEALDRALLTAEGHYKAEQAGEDGVRIEVV